MADAIDLVALDDVKAFLRVTDTARDGVIEDLITQASRMCVHKTQRQFTPSNGSVPVPTAGEDGAAKRFSYRDDGVIDLNPFDARSISGIVIDPDGLAETLDADCWLAEPVTQSEGVYTRVRVFADVVLKYTDRTVVEVTGDWGFSSVPADIQRSILKVVDLWFDRDVQQFTEDFQTIPDAAGADPVLPGGIMPIWNHYRRVGVT